MVGRAFTTVCVVRAQPGRDASSQPGGKAHARLVFVHDLLQPFLSGAPGTPATSTVTVRCVTWMLTNSLDSASGTALAHERDARDTILGATVGVPWCHINGAEGLYICRWWRVRTCPPRPCCHANWHGTGRRGTGRRGMANGCSIPPNQLKIRVEGSCARRRSTGSGRLVGRHAGTTVRGGAGQLERASSVERKRLR